MICYWIGPAPADDHPVWGAVVQTAGSARRSLDHLRVVLKWRGDAPEMLPEGGRCYSERPGPAGGTMVELFMELGGPMWTETDVSEVVP